MTKRKAIFKYLLLHALFLLFSAISVLSKLASRERLFSLNFFLFLGAVFAVLFIYAIVWQKILKIFPLIIAYSNKAITIVWGILFGRVFFNESISLGMILGALLIIIGIIIISFNPSKSKNNNALLLEDSLSDPQIKKDEGSV